MVFYVVVAEITRAPCRKLRYRIPLEASRWLALLYAQD